MFFRKWKNPAPLESRTTNHLVQPLYPMRQHCSAKQKTRWNLKRNTYLESGFEAASSDTHPISSSRVHLVSFPCKLQFRLILPPKACTHPYPQSNWKDEGKWKQPCRNFFIHGNRDGFILLYHFTLNWAIFNSNWALFETNWALFQASLKLNFWDQRELFQIKIKQVKLRTLQDC